MAAPLPHPGLQDWYLQARDGELAGTPGVRIDPLGVGWAVRVNLGSAELACRDCPEITITRTTDDWLHVWRDDASWRADCGPLSLTEAIKTYLAWAGRPFALDA